VPEVVVVVVVPEPVEEELVVVVPAFADDDDVVVVEVFVGGGVDAPPVADPVPCARSREGDELSLPIAPDERRPPKKLRLRAPKSDEMVATGWAGETAATRG